MKKQILFAFALAVLFSGFIFTSAGIFDFFGELFGNQTIDTKVNIGSHQYFMRDGLIANMNSTMDFYPYFGSQDTKGNRKCSIAQPIFL